MAYQIAQCNGLGWLQVTLWLENELKKRFRGELPVSDTFAIEVTREVVI